MQRLLGTPHCMNSLSWRATIALATFCSWTLTGFAEEQQAEDDSLRQVEQMLAASPKPADDLTPMHVLLLADDKDHGPAGNGFHDYPLWQERWALLLGGRKASAARQVNLVGPAVADPHLDDGASGVTVMTARGWATDEQFARADVIVAYCYLPWSTERMDQLRAYLKDGGGLVVVHSATWTRPRPSREVAELLGVGGFESWRHATVRLGVHDRKHPICVGMPEFMTLKDDEVYWPPVAMPKGVTVLASAVEVKDSRGTEWNAPQPQFWCYEPGAGRVFGCVPGHSAATFDDPLFRAFLLRGIAWAAGESPYRLDRLALRGVAPPRQRADVPEHPVNVWVKRSPIPDAPVSPRLGYETSMAYDPFARRIIRWGGHSQGGIAGSGDQIHDVWTLDPATMKWELKEPNLSPPPSCCCHQNVFDPVGGRFLRFQRGIASHGWHWYRHVYLNSATAWNYDLATNIWRSARPLPEPRIGLMNCASWDEEHQVAVVFGGEGTTEGTHIYDPWTNTWTTRRSAVEPPPRSAGNMAYDAARKLHVLFGSQVTNDPHTWAYDVAKNEWRDLKPERLPPTSRNDAVLAYDSANQAIVAVVRVPGRGNGLIGHLETWAFDAGRNKWTAMKPATEPQGPSSRTRSLVYVPDLNLFVLESTITPFHRVPGVDREQQIWTYRFAEAEPIETTRPQSKRTRPRIVEDPVVSVISAKEVIVSWPGSAGDSVVGYHVERAPVEMFSEDQIERLKRDTPPLEPPSAGGIKAVGTFTRLTSRPIEKTEFTDSGIDLTDPKPIEGELLRPQRFSRNELDPQGEPYRFAVFAYRVRAVDAAGNESGPSPYILTIPSAPQNLFSREDGETCHLKWDTNPEKAIRGYRIYSMTGPRTESPGQKALRLTADPIAATRFTDEHAGPGPRRYWIVAVDALGQEGIPSSGTWHNRTCREFYAPFVGEWHQ
ncbi:MAG: ThuA domain-containing protein [Planctomycetales bacterium]